MWLTNHKNQIALFLALLFHVCGAIGIICTPYRSWFINNTPFNLVLMTILLLLTQKKINLSFILFIITCFITGMLAEIIGINTGFLFGNYIYGPVFGTKFFGVPWLLGLNWFVIIFCAGNIIHRLNEWVYNKIPVAMQPSKRLKYLSFIADAAFLATFFDWIMEPAATKLGFWSWLPDNKIPSYNYVSWFIVSSILLTVFRNLKFDKHNQFALHLFIIQALFFLVLQTFL